MFGLNCKLQDTAKIPFLMMDGEPATLEKTMKAVDEEAMQTPAEFLLPEFKATEEVREEYD